MRWTEEETKYLLENYNELTDEELAGKLGRSRKAVSSKREKMGLRKDAADNQWTMKEVVYLKKYYRQMTDKEIAAVLGRSRKGVTEQRRRMGMEKKGVSDRQYICYDGDDVVAIGSLSVIADTLGIKRNTVNKYPRVRGEDGRQVTGRILVPLE